MNQQNIGIDCFNTILIKAINNNLSKMHIGKSEFSYDDLKKHIDDFNNMPLLKDSVFKKGVYQNFSEFKANNPTIINYNLNKGELADEIMVTENNHTYPLQNYWGYCDGKNVYIRSSNNLFRLFRAGNTFNTRAVKSLTIQKSISELPLGSISTIAKIGSEILGINEDPYKIYKKSFQLDMQTGEIF